MVLPPSSFELGNKGMLFGDRSYSIQSYFTIVYIGVS